jgi:2-dehydropantoate 2-reductase
MAGTWTDALEAIARRGVTVHEEDGQWSVLVRSRRIDDVADDSADLVLVLVKSHQTERVAGHAARAAAGNGLIVTLQNGLGNGETLAKAAGSTRVVLGSTSMGATSLGPGSVFDGGPGYTALATTSADGDRVAGFARLLTRAGMPTDLREDVQAIVWRKVAVNCAINPLSALLGVPNGRLLELDWALECMRQAALEAGAVAEAHGVVIGVDPVEAAIDVARQTASNRSSMLQDVERGRQTEIEAINGAVVRLGKQLGVATPVNRALLELVRERDMERLVPERAMSERDVSDELERARHRLSDEPRVHAHATMEP